MEFRKSAPEDAEELSTYLHPMWHEVFDGLLPGGADEAEFIFSTWTNPDAIRASMAEGYEFGFIHHEGERLGLYSYHILDDGRFYLNKLYLEPRFRGRNLGFSCLSGMEEIARRNGCRQMYLNVLYYNERAIKCYIRAGFDDYYRCLEPIGNGITRNDYVMIKHL